METCSRSLPSRSTPNITGPVAAEGNIEDDFMRVEFRVNVAVALEQCHGRPPARGLRVANQRVGGDTTAGEEPHLDEVAVPFHCIKTTPIAIESTAVTVGAVVVASTSLVAALVGGGDVAVGGQHLSGLAATIDCAAVARVEGNVIADLFVHSLNHVDFAVVGPVVTQSPDCECVRYHSASRVSGTYKLAMCRSRLAYVLSLAGIDRVYNVP